MDWADGEYARSGKVGRAKPSSTRQEWTFLGLRVLVRLESVGEVAGQDLLVFGGELPTDPGHRGRPDPRSVYSDLEDRLSVPESNDVGGQLTIAASQSGSPPSMS